MAVLAGQTIVNTNPPGAPSAADNPASAPILVAGAGGVQVAGFIFTNPTTSIITVSVYRDGLAASQLLFTVNVPALAGMTGGPAATQQLTQLTLAAGETIWAVGSLGGWVGVEIDGIAAGATSALTTNQLLMALLMQNSQAFGVDIPDVAILTNGYNQGD